MIFPRTSCPVTKNTASCSDCYKVALKIFQDIIHASDCDIKFSLKGIKAKITDFSLRGMIRVVLKVASQLTSYVILNF
jgi:hypothetical protein